MQDFNWREYLYCNPDLQQRRVKTENMVIQHYQTFGKNENRVLKRPTIEVDNNLSKDYTFVILRCVRSEKQSNLWIQCYNSIRKYHPNNKIIIIDNNSYPRYIKKIDLKNCDLINHTDTKSGEILPFFFFLKYKWSKYMIFFHDSMFLNKPLNANMLKVDKFKLFWHFSSGVHDHKTRIPHLLSYLKDNEVLQQLFLKKKHWFGAFGLSCTISLEFLEFIEKEHEFTNLVYYTKNRDDRKCLERILGLLFSYYDYDAVYNSYFGNVSTCPGFGRNNIQDHKEPVSENVKKWEELFSVSKVFVCR